MKVIKFGGTSLATGAQVQRAIAIVTADADRRVMVVSAPGKRQSDDVKVTDLLQQLADRVVDGLSTQPIAAQIIARYQEIATYFGLPAETVDYLQKHLDLIIRRVYPDIHYLYAALMAQGEFMNAKLISAVMQHLGLPARFVSPRDLGLIVDGQPQAVRIREESYAHIADFQLTPDEIIIVPGFFAYDQQGQITTFARGGSDITGSILARGFHADLYENFTDVSCVYAVDPKIVAHPRAINTLTYREMRELAYSGFSVFNHEAILPVIDVGIQVNIKNTNDLTAPGTLIVPDKDINHHHRITGIALNKNYIGLYLHRYLMNTEVGFTFRLLKILRKYSISYEYLPSGIDDLTIVINKDQLPGHLKERLLTDLKAEVHPDQLRWFDDFAVLMIVGEGLYLHADLLAKIMTKLSEKNIIPLMINQGASRISLMIGVHAEQAEEAVRAIYTLSEQHQDVTTKD